MSSERQAFSAQLCFAADHPTAAGHFPGYPIIPGAVLLDEIVAAVSRQGRAVCEVRMVKFMRPVRPSDCLALSWNNSGATDIKFEGRSAQGALALSGVLVSAGMI